MGSGRVIARRDRTNHQGVQEATRDRHGTSNVTVEFNFDTSGTLDVIENEAASPSSMIKRQKNDVEQLAIADSPEASVEETKRKFRRSDYWLQLDDLPPHGFLFVEINQQQTNNREDPNR